jgi:His-Xaa-Ser system protein HxsD
MDPIAVEFDCTAQSIGALRAAAYRLIGTATCEISKIDERWVCRLAPAGKGASDLRVRFLDLVTDENLRETIAAKTEPTRNLILALAFGHLAASSEGTPR